MDYQDALELKNAGYPFDTEYSHLDEYEFPTLSELIEACGERFLSVNKNFFPRPEKWFASASKDGGGMNRFGETCEQAVKNLWIALNKK